MYRARALRSRLESMYRKYLLPFALLGLASCSDPGSRFVGPDTPTATTITLSADALSFSSLGETHGLTASVSDQNGAVMPEAEVTWLTSADQVASVAADGSVAAVGSGTTTITASSGAASATAAVSVTQLPASITLSPGAPLALVGAGDQSTVTAVVLDAGGAEVPAPTLVWSSDDETIATVDEGEVEAIGGGTATITAEADGGTAPVSATLELTVGGAVLVDAAGGQFSLSNGDVSLTIPAGAVATPVFVDAQPELTLPAIPLAIPETAFDLTPDGTQFNESVTLTIAYDPSNVPSGISEADLRVHKVVGDEYVEIDGATVNVGGNTASGTIDGFSIYAIVPRVRVTTTALPTGFEGAAYSHSLEAEGGNNSYSWTTVAGAVPPGLSLASNGDVAGTPTSTGTFDVTVEVTSGGQMTQQSLSMMVTQQGTLTVTTTSAPDGIQNTDYGTESLSAVGGDGNYAWTVTSGSPPAGLSVSASGQITGVPTGSGTSDFTVEVTSAAQTAQQPLSITVWPTLSVTTASLPEGVVGTDYGTETLAASGGEGSYAWALAPGSAPLPAGLALAGNGTITGTPSSAGTSTFDVVVTSGIQSVERELSITIRAVLAVTTTSLPDGVVGVSFGDPSLDAEGGVGSYSWALAAGSGALPAGLTLETDGSITGSPTATGLSDFTVQVSSGAETAQRALSITVEALAVTTNSLPDGSPGVDYGVVSLAAAGGDGSYAWTLLSGALPTGLALAANGDITGTPTALETADFTVQVASDGLTAQAALSINVNTSFNLSVDVVQLNQGNQSADGSIGGIADRPGLLRVVVRANEANGVTPQVRVRLYDGASLLREELLDAPLTGVPVSPDLDNLTDTWNLALDAADVVPGLGVEVLLDPAGAIIENDLADNAYPLGGGALDLDVRERQPLKLLFIPIQSTFHNTLGSLTAANADDFLESSWQWLPTSEISWEMHAAFSTGEDLSTGDGWSTLLSDIQALRTAEGATDEYYHGIIGDFSGIRYGGLAYRPSSPTSRNRTGLSYDRWPYTKGTIGHELGHNLGRRHAPCGNPNGPDPDFPHDNARIGTPGYNILTGALVPSTTADFMSYCGPEWTSDYTYEEIRDWRLADTRADPSAAASQSAPSQGVLLWGRIHSGGVDLNPALTLEAVASLPSGSGPNTLRGLASDGRELFRYSFEGTSVADTPDPAERHFSFFVPLDATSLAALDQIVVDAPEGTAAQDAASSAGLPAGPVAAAAAPPTITPMSGGSVRIQWDAARYPMAVIRDRDTGQILMFARGGDAVAALGSASVDQLEVIVSDGVKSQAVVR